MCLSSNYDSDLFVQVPIRIPIDEGKLDSHMGCIKTHMSMTQEGPNQKIRWKAYSL